MCAVRRRFFAKPRVGDSALSRTSASSISFRWIFEFFVYRGDMASRTSSASARARMYLPDSGEREQIVDFALALRQIESSLTTPHPVPALVGPDGAPRAIPNHVFELLELVVDTLADGKGVMIAPYGALLTTQEAADFLGISRPTLVKLLETGQIEHQRRGRHRRVQLKHLIDYQDRSRSARRASLDEMTREGQRLGLPNSRPPALERG